MIMRRGAKIAVLELFGVIGSRVRPAVYGPMIESLRRSKRVRAVVLDIDSPGGSASASDFIHRGIARIANEKPVVAFVRGTGTSGAYWISCAAHKVVALPTSIVGSIGVISAQPIVEQLLGRVGISMSVNKSGKFKDMGAFWRQQTAEEEQKIQGLIDELFNIFVGTVATGRKMDEVKVRELATGEVFTGLKGKELGLVDELGDFDTALDMASQMAGVKRRVIYVRPHAPLFQRFFGRAAEALVDSVWDATESRLTGNLRLFGPGGIPRV